MREVFATGRKVMNRLVVVYYRQRGTGSVRLAVTVARRSGGAVVRNRMKRRVREAARHEVSRRGGWVKVDGLDVVLIARGAVRE
ncbi:MAG: ribonuclease P protein component, partial [Clostridia bacterium]|nr:ribonuclease P protein component [Clostridia bacterium]